MTHALLRLATAGSVDDGKSTLVGRLLYDTKSVLADQLEDPPAAARMREFVGEFRVGSAELDAGDVDPELAPACRAEAERYGRALAELEGLALLGFGGRFVAAPGGRGGEPDEGEDEQRDDQKSAAHRRRKSIGAGSELTRPGHVETLDPGVGLHEVAEPDQRPAPAARYG